MTKLTQQQRDDLITQYIEIVVDSMSVDELVNLGMNKLQEEFNSYDLDELKSKIGQYDPELFDELVDNVLYIDSKRKPFEPVEEVATVHRRTDLDRL
tara:strand:- start:110 stop:400 length:291 start_codon:yes stop_codon:yes gene_type:complete